MRSGGSIDLFWAQWLNHGKDLDPDDLDNLDYNFLSGSKSDIGVFDGRISGPYPIDSIYGPCELVHVCRVETEYQLHHVVSCSFENYFDDFLRNSFVGPFCGLLFNGKEMVWKCAGEEDMNNYWYIWDSLKQCEIIVEDDEV